MEDKENTLGEESVHEVQEIVVDPGQEPLRIDKFLMARLAKVTRNRVQQSIKSGAVTVDGVQVKPNFKVKPGHLVQIVIPRHPLSDQELVPEKMDLNIRYEDEDVLVLEKPAGMVVHPGIGNYTGTLVNGLAYYFKDLPVLEGNDADRPGLVHRIDKDTTGLMVVGKNEHALSHLARQFFDHTVDRAYKAIVWGEPEELEGVVESNIGRDLKDPKKYRTFPLEEEVGKWAYTSYKTLEPLYYVSLIECRLKTGRTHQIRVHMKHLGHPLFNDAKYNGDRIHKGTVFSKYKSFVDKTFLLCPRQALHAYMLGFDHPRTGERMHFESPLPEDMTAALDRWRAYVNQKKASKKPL